MVLGTWICGRNFPENEKSKPVTSRKTNDSIHYQFWKNLHLTPQWLESFLKHKDFSNMTAGETHVTFKKYIMKCVTDYIPA